MAWCALLSVAVLVAAASAAYGEDDLVLEEVDVNAETPEEVLAYWTPEAMASAIPMEVELSEEEEAWMLQQWAAEAEAEDWAGDYEELTEEAIPGEAEEDDSYFGLGSLFSSGSHDSAEDYEYDYDEFAGDISSGSHDSLEAFGSVSADVSRANVKIRPYKTGGKMYFTNPENGKRYACSAQFVGRTKIIMTAAHCVISKTGTWYTKRVLYRAFKNGGGQKVAVYPCAVNRKYYHPSRNLGYDYAFCLSDKKGKGGALGLKANVAWSRWPRGWHAIGYPSNFESGRYMQVDYGTKGSKNGQHVEMLNMPMGPGCSGGAWIDKLATRNRNVGTSNYAISVNSYSKRSEQEHQWGPYFDRAAWNVYIHQRNKVDRAERFEAAYYYGTRAAGAGALAVLALAAWRARRKAAEHPYQAVGAQEEAQALL